MSDPGTDSEIWGMLDGRESHVLPESGGELAHPIWLEGLAAERLLIRRRLPALVRGPVERGAFSRIASLGVHTASHGSRSIGSVAIARRRGNGAAAAHLAERTRLLFEALGPTYIKFGQVISGSPGLFHEAFVKEFEKCRDAVPAVEWGEAAEVLSEDLPGWEREFAEINDEPMAAASIAQVHEARLRDGREVVVKIQRPGIGEKVWQDLQLLALGARMALRRWEVLGSANPLAAVEFFARTILEELDFRLEAENQLDVAESVARSRVAGGVVVPRPHSRLVNRRVLVMERIHGYPYSATDQVKAAGIDTREMLKARMVCFAEGALLHGVFHGDLHGGNVLICPDGREAILDFGIVGRFSPAERRALANLMAAGVRGDTVAQLRAMQEMGSLPLDADLEEIAAEMPAVPMLDMRVPTLAELREIMQGIVESALELNFKIPTLLLMMTKDLIFLDESVNRYAPGMDLVGEVGDIFLEITEMLEAGGP